MKDHAFFQGEIITNYRKFKNLLLQNHWANYNQTWRKASLGEEDLSFSKLKDHTSTPGDNNQITKDYSRNLKVFHP